MAPDKGKAGPSRPAINRPLPASVSKLAQEAVTVLPIIEAEKRAAASATGTTGGSSNTNGNANAGSTGRFRARYQAFQGTRAFKGFSFVKKYRRSFLFGAFVIYTSYSYTAAALHARKRDKIRDSTYLYWKIYDGSIVEAKSSTTVLNSLLFSGGTGGSDEPARIMTIFDVVRTLNWAMRDDRIKGIVADFSSLSAPAVQAGYSLGLAQIEEIGDAIEELNRVKSERLGPKNWRSIAFTDSFDSQAQYTLASHFNEVYMQPTGEVPLTGLGSQLPFFKRLIDWLSIGVQAEAREEYKSIVAQYTREKLSEPQTENQVELLNSLNDLMLQRIARNRFVEPPKIQFNPFPFGVAPQVSPETSAATANAPAQSQVLAASPLEKEEAVISTSETSTASIPEPETVAESSSPVEAVSRDSDLSEVDALVPAVPAPVPQSILDKVRKLTFEGPFSAREATENGLITGMSYRTYIFDSILESEFGGSEENHMMGFYHYYKVMDRAVSRKTDEPVLDVGVVYLMGTIGESGDFDAGSVVRGLRQAGEDDKIGCVVLRIDSGGGGVVDSDSIDQAVRDLREKKGKVVISSFSNAAASGGYLAACHTDAILAHPSTITGSIGVAAVRPSFGTAFTDKLKVTVQTILTGSKANDLTSELTGRDLERYRKHIDETYDDFKNRVVEGRQIHPELINSLAGGRVYTGQMAYELLVEEVERLRVKAESQKQEIADTPSTEKEAPASVQMPEDQEMSPYAPPDVIEAEGKAVMSPSGILEELDVPPLGPMGRGIVDGLGGIRDAAALAAEVFLTRSLSEVKHEHPDLTDAEAIEQIVPGLKYEVTDDGKAILPIDINLKQFPAEKSFWQLYKEATSRGDSMTDPEGTSSLSVGNHMKVLLASWVLAGATKTVSSELDSLGLADVRRSMGIGAKQRGRPHMKAQAPAWQLR